MRRIVHGTWFIQSQQGKNKWIAWASKDRLASPLAPSVSDVYFNVGETESEAIDNLIKELDAIDPGKGVENV